MNGGTRGSVVSDSWKIVSPPPFTNTPCPQLVGSWPLSAHCCIAWVFADVFLCTSSILALTAICIDRYLAISMMVTNTI